MSDFDKSDLARQIRESLERIYAQESPEKKRIREKNAEQLEVAGSGEWFDPFGKPAPAPLCKQAASGASPA